VALLVAISLQVGCGGLLILAQFGERQEVIYRKIRKPSISSCANAATTTAVDALSACVTVYLFPCIGCGVYAGIVVLQLSLQVGEHNTHDDCWIVIEVGNWFPACNMLPVPFAARTPSMQDSDANLLSWLLRKVAPPPTPTAPPTAHPTACL
jgi:hypothetical protein